jgi:hypothetical protein
MDSLDQGLAIVIGACIGLLGALAGVYITHKSTAAQIEHERYLAERARDEAIQAREDVERERIRIAGEREAERREQHLFDALRFFTGGTQERSAGIAVVEVYWPQVQALRGMLAPLLANQAIYLLNESGQGAKRHERHNLQRLMKLLLENHDDPGVRHVYPPLLEVVTRRLSGAEPLRGIEVDEGDLANWKVRLESGLVPD